MNIQTHEELKAKIWEIANRLRGPYRPPQYRLVMLPMVVLRRLDCVLEPTKDAVLKKLEQLEAQQMPEAALDRLLGKAADPKRKHALYNTSPYTFARLLGDAENIAPNLVSYMNGFSPTARHIFERFKFAEQIETLDASNRLFTIVKAMTDVDLHPSRIDNLQMGYLFEHPVMRFNEQSNEEAGDHFTPREVIRLMANLIYTGEQDVYKPGIFRTIYDPACGTGGMLSESEQLILSQNERAQLALFAQDYNDESWAICCSDMLIKDEDTANIVLGDTLGDGKTRDGFEGERFHYLMANPPFGVEWKDQKDVVQREHKTVGFSGRFGAALQHGVVLRQHRDDHRGVFRALALVDRRRISEHQHVQFAEAVRDAASVEPGDQLAGLRVDAFHGADVAVVDVLVVVVLDLHDLVAGREGPAEALDLLLAGGVQRRLQLDIERPRADASPVHRAQHLDVAHRMEAEPAGNALADQGQDALHRLFGILRRHEVEVAVALSRVELRHLARVDPMRIDDDPALGRLPEHVGQAHDRDRTGAESCGCLESQLVRSTCNLAHS